MEKERDQRELKHVCKLCDKRFPSGKSLGGHMRSHVIASNSYVSAHKMKFNTFYAAAKKDLSFDDGVGGGSANKRDLRAVVENVGAGCSGWSNGVGDGSNGGHSGYVLRENPKKTWRMTDSRYKLKQEGVCKQCGKVFQSLKALCGHMSSHSGKERNFHHGRWEGPHDDVEDYDESKDKDDGESWDCGDGDDVEEGEDKVAEELAAMESLSDNLEEAEYSRQKRQRQQKFRSKPKPVSRNSCGKYKTPAFDLSSLANGSSSNNSEIGQEQEDVAMCLMMLSRDQPNPTQHRKKQKGSDAGTGTGTGISGGSGGCGLNMTAESSDNNSLILEGGSSSTHVGFGERRELYANSNGLDLGNNKKMNVALKKMQPQQGGGSIGKKLKREINVEIDNSDSGYFENGSKELESDDSSVGGFVQNFGFMKKPKLEFAGSGSGPKHMKQSSTGDYSKGRDAFTHYFTEEHYAHNKYGAEIRYDSRSRTRNGSSSSNVDAPQQTKIAPQTPQKGSDERYECSICDKPFKTRQALGGHVITHKKSKDRDTSVNGSIAPKSAPTKTGSKKTKGHKCPFCSKGFRSGQALGGHKRSHLIGAGAAALLEKAAAGPPVPVQEVVEEEKQPLLDLNLPAPMEEEANGDG